MGRPAKLWRKKGRAGFWATVDGEQKCFGTDRRAAEKAFHAAKALAAEKAAAAAAGGREPVSSAIGRYLHAIRGKVKPKTYANYLAGLRDFHEAHGTMEVRKLTARHLSAWMDRPSWNGSTRRTRGGAVKGWMKWLVKEGVLPADPFAGVRLPKMGTRDAADLAELDAILARATPHFRDFLAVLVETGCRPDEICTLTADRVDPATSTATVIGKTGPRLIGLSPAALAILSPLMARHPEGPVLRTRRGCPWTETAYQRRMRRYRGEASTTTAYHARHAFWSRAVKAGVNDVAIGMQLGHADLAMLRKVYAHADPEIMADVARRASGKGTSGAAGPGGGPPG